MTTKADQVLSMLETDQRTIDHLRVENGLLLDALKELSADVMEYGTPALTMRYATAHALRIIAKRVEP